MFALHTAYIGEYLQSFRYLKGLGIGFYFSLDIQERDGNDVPSKYNFA